jgi:hypothetical protein
VDVFGQHLLFAIFNGLNYHPRPVFQSYAAYNRPVMEWNERFYQSSNAPEYVIFFLSAIDGRFPPLEDSLALRTLLLNYDYAGRADYSLILRRSRSAAPKTTLLAEGDVRWNEKIEVSKFGTTNLWMEMDPQPSLAGRARQFLYQPAETRLAVWSETNKVNAKRFRAPAPMLAAGFWANPLQEQVDDVEKWYQGGSLNHVLAYALESDSPSAWQERIHYRIYEIENPRPPGKPAD